MNYLLDANVCIAIMNGRPDLVRDRFRSAITEHADIAVPSIVAFELWYGVGKIARRDLNAHRLRTFLRAPIEVVPFEEEDAEIAGMERPRLEEAGTPIGAYDLLIAAQALRHRRTLVTANVAEFSRVQQLVWQDWAGQ